jgi:hypothetical protein
MAQEEHIIGLIPTRRLVMREGNPKTCLPLLFPVFQTMDLGKSMAWS